jgi:arylsulfatase A-like enzyme
MLKIQASDQADISTEQIQKASLIKNTINPFLRSFLFLGILMVISCQKEEQIRKPNIVYILVDQWRSSALGYAGNTDVITPNLDRFALEAVNFKNAVTVSPVCTPHRASLLTGRYPTSTGMFLNDLYLPDEELCMAEIFKSVGYNTGYLGKWHLDGHGRLNNVVPERRQGFDYWKALECSHNYNKMPYYDNKDPEMKYWEGFSPFAIAEDANKYISEQAKKDSSFLLFVSIAAPHFPHHSAPQEIKNLYVDSALMIAPNVPEETKAQATKELLGYYEQCTATDEAVGRILSKIKEEQLWDNTIIVFTSDHGEMMGAHGVRPFAKQLAWDESIKVPFLISYPGIGENKGAVVNAPINTPDILPSLLGLADIEMPATIEGEDISDLIKFPDPEADRAALVMSVCPFATEYAFDEYRGIRTKQYTYVSTPDSSTLLFDNIQDPFQLNNLISKSEFKPLKEEMDIKLRHALRKIGDENFKHRDYYLEKWNYTISDKNQAIDYHSFETGDGVVQGPKVSVGI